MLPRYHNTKTHNGILLRAGLGKNKEQSIGTPDWLLDHVYALLGDPIDLDPCDDGQKRVRALHHCIWPNEDGLQHSWAGKTVFFNPPFENLGVFLRKAFLSWWHQRSECLGLFPIRSHRNYWIYARTAPRICGLPSFAFHGHKDQAPFPLCVAYWGPQLEAFDRIFSFGSVDCPLTIGNATSNILGMEHSNLQAQYLQAAGNARRNSVLDGIRRLPPQEVTIQILEEILDEQEFELVCETPFSELFPVPGATTFATRNADMKTETQSARVPQTKKAPAPAPIARPKAPKTPKESDPALERDILRCINRGDEKGVSAQEIADSLGTEIKKIRPTINSLLADETIISSGKTRGTRYHPISK